MMGFFNFCNIMGVTQPLKPRPLIPHRYAPTYNGRNKQGQQTHAAHKEGTRLKKARSDQPLSQVNFEKLKGKHRIVYLFCLPREKQQNPNIKKKYRNLQEIGTFPQ